MINYFRENQKVILSTSTIISFIIAALAFIRSNDVDRISAAEQSIKSNTDKINQLELQQQILKDEEATQIQVLEEVRLDVKRLLIEVATKETK